MAKLIYSMLTSLDNYILESHGRFGWGAPEVEQSTFLLVEERRFGSGVVVLRHAARR